MDRAGEPATNGRDGGSPSGPAREGFDPQAMVERFRQRADAVRSRGLPPVEGPERQRIMAQMKLDYMDFAILGDAVAALDDGILTLTIDLRPR